MDETKLKRHTSWFSRQTGLLVAIGLALTLCILWACYYHFARAKNVAALNGLRDEINAIYGFKDGTPRVNCGPCIRFAIAFRDKWNSRFSAKAEFACLVAPPLCGHVAVKLPDGSYFDGGNGVMSQSELAMLCSDCTVKEMDDLDMSLFEKQDVELLHQPIGSQNQFHYLECPNYSDDVTAKLIDKSLAKLGSG